MRLPVRDRLIANGVILTLIFCLTARPVLNAADSGSASSAKSGSRAEELFRFASDLSDSLHNRPSDERGISDYRRVLDAYGQVIRLNTDNFYSAESLIRRAELLHEMADAAGDGALYQQAIDAYRRVIADHPHSGFVGDALASIAQIYEENLQDLEGAARAYRELVEHFPASVMARQAEAVLERFESQLGNRPADVLISNDALLAERAQDLTGPDLASTARLTNVRNFSGPDYARILLDLSGQTVFSQRRSGNNISLQLKGATVAQSLFGRRFIVADASLLKRITVAQTDSTGIRIDIQASSIGDYSFFRLPEPERMILDIHSVAAAADARARDAAASPVVASMARESSVNPSEGAAPPRAAASKTDRSPLYSLPEINDPIVPLNPADKKNSDANRSNAAAVTALANALGAKIDSKVSEAPVRRIVIDPGHGGHDTGTISPNGLREKDLVLDVARRLRAYVKRNYPGVEVILTRDSDRFVALEERTAIANSRHADLFISVHANASPSRVASGVETFFVSPDRVKPEDAQTANRENSTIASEATADKSEAKPQPVYASVTVGNRVAQSRELARYIQSGLVRGIGAASPKTALNRGVKHAAFVVLLGATMPSVLAEISFLSNSRDEALLQTAEFRERVAASLFAGLNAYLKKNRQADAKGH
jgi:N-acetylmuramoyl-L-alanine amidase